LDTSNIVAIEAALKVCKLTPIINSIMCRPERYEKMVPLAAEHNADFVALMWGPEGLPRDENERAALAVELLYFVKMNVRPWQLNFYILPMKQAFQMKRSGWTVS